MRVLAVHNYYQQPGGEDRVFRAEAELLRQHGHTVVEYAEHNERIGGAGSLRLAWQTVWSEPSRRKLAGVLADFRPDVAHFHNTFPLVSPAAYYACQQAGVRVVQTLHNYRLACPKATYYREGKVCEDCQGKLLAWPSVVNACYRGARRPTAVIAVMNATHRLARTWARQVDTYIALSQFARHKLVSAGLPASRIVVKGNFVQPDPGVSHQRDRFVLFVGRLIAEKGIGTLLDAWARLDSSIPLKIVGDGDLANQVSAATRKLAHVEWLGRRPAEDVVDLMGRAAALVFPSEWHEPFGLVAIEAFARGTPVIAARAGAIPEMVQHQYNGLLYEPGEAQQLAASVAWAVDHPAELADLGRHARRTYEANFTSERNYAALLEIYQNTARPRSV